MNVRKHFLIISLATSAVTSLLYAQDEKSESAIKEPIVDEFSIIMRNFMNRAQSVEGGSQLDGSSHKLEAKVDDIQTLLHKSDMQVKEAAKIHSVSSVRKSENIQDRELEKVKAKIADDCEGQLARLTITKAKIATVKKGVKDKKQRLALDKASRAVDAALKQLESSKE